MAIQKNVVSFGVTAMINFVIVRELSVNGCILLNWLNTINQFCYDNQILPENVYNMDKSGFSIGSIQATYIIIDSIISLQF